MRSLITGLLGLCLGLALTPTEASARADARSSAQPSTTSRSAPAARPTASRPTASRPATSRPTASRSATSRPTTSRPTTSGATASGATASRQAATRPTAGRLAVLPSRQASSRANTANQRQALIPRNSGSSRSAWARGGRQVAAIPYSRQNSAASARGLRQTAMASCTTRNGRRVCTPGVTRTASIRWTGGLAPAAMSQTNCPDGTIATLAIGHNDITRCVPL